MLHDTGESLQRESNSGFDIRRSLQCRCTGAFTGYVFYTSGLCRQHLGCNSATFSTKTFYLREKCKTCLLQKIWVLKSVYFGKTNIGLTEDPGRVEPTKIRYSHSSIFINVGTKVKSVGSVEVQFFLSILL